MYVALYDSSAGFEGAGVPRRWGVARLRVDRLSAPLAGRDAAGLGGQRIRSRRCTGTAQLSRLCASRRALFGCTLRTRGAAGPRGGDPAAELVAGVGVVPGGGALGCGARTVYDHDPAP